MSYHVLMENGVSADRGLRSLQNELDLNEGFYLVCFASHLLQNICLHAVNLQLQMQ